MKPTKPLRFLHVSTRYGLRVMSVSPYVTEFVKLAPGITYRRAAPKPKRPGRARRTRLAVERIQSPMWRALAQRRAAQAMLRP